jgi:hypothetical protein
MIRLRGATLNYAAINNKFNLGGVRQATTAEGRAGVGAGERVALTLNNDKFSFELTCTNINSYSK